MKLICFSFALLARFAVDLNPAGSKVRRDEVDGTAE
jgi:hypothetical protein